MIAPKNARNYSKSGLDRMIDGEWNLISAGAKFLDLIVWVEFESMDLDFLVIEILHFQIYRRKREPYRKLLKRLQSEMIWSQPR